MDISNGINKEKFEGNDNSVVTDDELLSVADKMMDRFNEAFKELAK